MGYQLFGIPEGAQGTRATLRMMAKLAREGAITPQIRELAISLTSGLASEDWFSEIAALHAYVRDRIRYIQDVNQVETIAPPGDTLRLGAGDCDDKSILLASLLESIGHPARFMAVSFGDPENFEHVLVETRLGQGWLPLETTKPEEPGWFPEGVVARMAHRVK